MTTQPQATLRIRNWASFQHYKDRNPPWIRLYRDLLNDREWFGLTGEEARLLVNLWLLAAEDETHEGVLPALPDVAFRLRISASELQAMLPALGHWLVGGASSVLAGRYQVGTPETETETETEAETDVEGARKSARPSKLGTRWTSMSVIDDDWIAWAVAEQGLTHADATLEGDKFGDYWRALPGAKARKLDWRATWRNWIRNRNSSRSNGNGTGHRTAAQQRQDYWDGQAALAGFGPEASGSGDGVVVDVHGSAVRDEPLE